MRTFNTDRLYLKPMADGEWTRVVDRILDADEGYIQFGCPVTRDMIGYVEFTPSNKNVGYYIFEEYRHQGYAYEGVKAFMEACKLGFREFGDDEDFLCYDPEREEEIEEKVA